MQELTKYTPTKLTTLEVAFPVTVKHLMPESDERPPAWAEAIAGTWFYKGLDDSVLIAKDGIDRNDAIRHLQAVLGSFEPKHEDKMNAAGLLIADWFLPTPAKE